MAALLLRWRDIDFGDLPSSIAMCAAIIGGVVALFQLREQRKAISEAFARQRKCDELLDVQLEH